MDWLTMDTLAQTLRIASPILLATMGGLVSRVSGQMDVALEGKILLGAFFAVAFSILSGSAWLGVLGAALVVMLLSLLMGYFTIGLKANQIIAGIALNLLCFALTTFLLRRMFGVAGFLAGPRIVGLPVWGEGIQSLPLVGPILGGHTPLTYVGWLSIAVLWVAIYHTPSGLRLRAAGQHPGALATAGINVPGLRYVAMAINGLLCGLAGADLSLGQLNMFSEGMSAGRGFMAFAAVEFGNFTPLGSGGAALFFGLAQTAALRLQGLQIPSQLVLTLPFSATVAALFLVEWRKRRKGEPIQEKEDTL